MIQLSKCFASFTLVLMTTQSLQGEILTAHPLPIPTNFKSTAAGPTGPTGPAGPQGATGATGPQGQSAVTPNYAFYYNPNSQLSIYAGETINLTILDPENAGGFTAPINGGVSIPQSGAYAISYSVFTNVKNAVIALAVNGKALPKTSVSGPLNQNTLILRLNAGDILTLTNGLLSGPINALSVSTNTRLPTVPISLTLQQIGF
ncbi:collagen-like protein [Parachlamydia acanthamoebae]|uniref:collagen-like protein n=1 Tax=Parachlamydia acanthamoebae TaxID=83552 RepID=UPI0001C17B6C|nr:collagen-like protein [Parachlamydia acanthamoebae]EFB42682.1 hypothetical protein pah_c004o233 [Parachlamydia acanthamoebae str. Hall's coccus]